MLTGHPVDGAASALEQLERFNWLTRLVAETAELTDRQYRIGAAAAEGVAEAGFARHFVPARWGGTAGTFAGFTASVAALAEHCASTAWCAALYAAHGRLAAYLPEQAQRELWGRSPDVRIAAAVVPPAGRAEAADGGWRLSGEWRFASGVDHAEWILLCSPAEGVPRIFAVPVAEVEVRDTWRGAGLRGTGSNTVLLDGVPVPGHRSCSLADLGRAPDGAARCHAVPYQLVGALQFAAPALGAARGALADWTAAQAARRRPDGRSAADSPAVQEVLAGASGQIHAARLLVEHAALRADTARPGPLAIAENQRDLAAAAELCATAVGRLFRSAGARRQQEGDSLQRRWRDVTAAAGHPTLDPGAAAEAYARAVLAAPGAGA